MERQLERILLINPPGDERSTRDRILNYGIGEMPLGILSIASVLRMHGRRVAVLDLYAHRMGREAFARFVEEFRPDVVGMSVYTLSVPDVYALSRLTRELLRDEAVIIFGGPHASFRAHEMLTDGGGDYVVRHEGEATISELLVGLETGAPAIDRIRGVSFMEGDRLVENPERPRIWDIEALPYANALSVDAERYGRPYSLSTSRGCPGDCIFCAGKRMAGGGYREISAEGVYDRFAWIAEWHRLRAADGDVAAEPYVYVEDPCFTADGERVTRFCTLKSGAGLTIEWECLSRLDTISVPLLRAMAAAQCRAVLVGVESADPGIQRTARKEVSPERLEHLLGASREIGIELGLSFILGLPGETKETIRSTWEYVQRIWERYELLRVDMNVNAVYPGTYQERHLEELGLRVESRNPRRCSRVRPAVYTESCGTEDIHRIMVEYFRFKKKRDRWNKARRKVRYPLHGRAGNAETPRFASRWEPGP